MRSIISNSIYSLFTKLKLFTPPITAASYKNSDEVMKNVFCSALAMEELAIEQRGKSDLLETINAQPKALGLYEAKIYDLE